MIHAASASLASSRSSVPSDARQVCLVAGSNQVRHQASLPRRLLSQYPPISPIRPGFSRMDLPADWRCRCALIVGVADTATDTGEPQLAAPALAANCID